MKKKLLAGLLSVAMVATMFAGCGKKEEKVINVMAFTDEVPKMVQAYLDAHKDLGYTMKELSQSSPHIFQCHDIEA